MSLGGWMLDSEVTDFHSEGGICSYGVQLTGNGPIRLIRTKITDGTLHGNVDPSAPILDKSGCTTPVIEDCEISRNTNYNGAAAAGVLSLNATGHYVSFTRCRCTDNAARHGVLRGGSSNPYNNMLYATNCLFARNVCIPPRYGTGSGKYTDLFWARGEYVNCTIADNGSEGDVLVFNCIGREDRQHQIYFQNTVISGNDVIGTYASGGNVPTTTHSIYPEAVEGDGDLTGPARFIGRGRDPYRLAAGSPGVGAGALLGWTKDDTDLIGNRRVQGGAVDMGCYQSTTGMMLLVQ